MATKEISKEKRVKVNIPYVKGEARDIAVGVNGKIYQIQKGKTVEVPVSVAKILRRREAQIAAALDYEESLSTASSPEDKK